MKITIVGLGYIGLPTAAILASKGNNVVGLDIDKKVVETVNSGNIHIVEPGLESITREVVENGYLRATTIAESSDVFIIAVPTPFKGNFKPDISYIYSSIESISPIIKKGDIIILESTSPVGTTEKILEKLKSNRPDLYFPEYGSKSSSYDVSIAYCPERILPGKALEELEKNSRVIGGISRTCAENAVKVYKLFVKGDCILTNSRTAELCKLVENSYRDVNIAFANELSIISDKLDINVWDLIELANHHPRVDILQPGPGVGGHCISVDPWFIVDSVPNEAKLIRTARQVNDSKPSHVLRQVDDAINKLGKNISDTSITCLGLSFKADIDDLRESPALEIVKSLCQLGFNRLNIVEPNISILPNSVDSNMCSLVSLKFGIKDADIIVVLVDHSEFKLIDESLLVKKHLVDTRGVFHRCGVQI